MIALLAALLLMAPPESLPEGKHEYFRLYATTEDGERMVVVKSNESLENVTNAPYFVLHLTPKVTVQLRNEGEGSNPTITPKKLRELHLQGRDIWLIATWTGFDPPELPKEKEKVHLPVNWIRPDHILVIQAKDDKKPEKE